MIEGRCKQGIYDSRGSWQCSRKAVVGQYCKQHDPVRIAKKRRVRSEQSDKEWEAKKERWHKQDVRNAAAAGIDIAILEKYPELLCSAPALLEALKKLLADGRELIQGEECDHDVGVCWCAYFSRLEAAEKAIAQAEKK